MARTCPTCALGKIADTIGSYRCQWTLKHAKPFWYRGKEE